MPRKIKEISVTLITSNFIIMKISIKLGIIQGKTHCFKKYWMNKLILGDMPGKFQTETIRAEGSSGSLIPKANHQPQTWTLAPSVKVSVNGAFSKRVCKSNSGLRAEIHRVC